METVNAASPVWTRRRTVFLLATDAFGLVVTCALLVAASGSGVTAITGLNPTADAVRQLTRWVNVACPITLSVIAIDFIGQIIKEARLYRPG